MNTSQSKVGLHSNTHYCFNPVIGFIKDVAKVGKYSMYQLMSTKRFNFIVYNDNIGLNHIQVKSFNKAVALKSSQRLRTKGGNATWTMHNQDNENNMAFIAFGQPRMSQKLKGL